MRPSHSATSLAEFVTEAPAEAMAARQSPVCAANVLHDHSEHPDVRENELRRRAHLQALALMVASGLVSTLALYGIWTLLRGAV